VILSFVSCIVIISIFSSIISIFNSSILEFKPLILICSKFSCLLDLVCWGKIGGEPGGVGLGGVCMSIVGMM
jgi:hypothetical protein